jgi:hypothetical protein
MTDAPMKVVVDCATGESTTVPLTEAELAQREIDRVAFEAAEEERLATESAKAEAQSSAIAKLEALGLTADEIAALKS